MSEYSLLLYYPLSREFGRPFPADAPLTLAPDVEKLVLSPHVYGPSVAPQSYFDDATFPKNMEAIWEAHFGFVASRGLGCLVIGEWGGWFTNNDATWQRAFSAFLTRRRLSHFYWALNPTSRDTGGLLLADWASPSANKLAMLATMPATPVIPGSESEDASASHEAHHKHTHDAGAHDHAGGGGGGHHNASSGEH